MVWLKPLLLLLLITLCGSLAAQPCAERGQNPSTAFPVCGTSIFEQDEVPLCGNRPLPGHCGNQGITDTNPFWYKFTCFTDGTLGFKITPANLNDDYDWQLYDVTGRNVNDVYTDPSMEVSCNWSGESGLTGASSQGSQLFVCVGYGQPLWSSMPVLKKGHEYLLLISHFTQTQSGYKLEFHGGTANITDPTPPKMLSATASCDGQDIRLKLNKRFRCNSLTSMGTEFKVNAANLPVGASAAGCASGFDFDEVTITLDKPLSPGKYTLSIRNGSDNNTLLDYCEQPIPQNQQVDFDVLPLAPTPMDSLSRPGCNPKTFELVFPKKMRCNSIASDGSDFVIETLPGGVAQAITSAAGSCGSGLTSNIIVTLNESLATGGNYRIRLKKGSDGNTLVDECGVGSLEGQTIDFSLKDTVNADFTLAIRAGCTADTVYFNHPGGNGVNTWNWELQEFGISRQQNPTLIYSSAGTRLAKLLVSNGMCRDSTELIFQLEEKINAAFVVPEFVCPNEGATVTNTSTGNILSWNWDFGNGIQSSERDPGAQPYAAGAREIRYTIKLTATDPAGCIDTALRQFIMVNSCVIKVPNAFTPNNDGRNEQLYPANAWKADNLLFRVYNRYGQLIFETRDRTARWDGTLKGNPQPEGAYVWTLQYIHRDTKQSYFFRGTSMLIR